MAASFVLSHWGWALRTSKAVAARFRQSWTLARTFSRHLTGFFRMLGHLAFAVHVGGKGHIPQFGQLLGAPASIVVESPPFMHYQHPRPRSGYGIIPGEIALTFEIAMLVGDLFGLHGRLSRANQHQP